jgi:excinuclease ABC subunit A
MQMNPIDKIEIRGARVHNLKNVDLDIPLRKLTCFAGPSGSGKTSLAFHTLLSESRRRFVNSFPNSVKFFTDRPAAVDVDMIFPVLPVFGLPQINPVVGARSVVADIMRLTDSLQNLYYSFSTELCPVHLTELRPVSLGQQLKAQLPKKIQQGIFHILVRPLEYQRIFGEDFLPARSFTAKRKTVENFIAEDELWEVMRFKWEGIDQLDQKWEELNLHKFPLVYQIWSKDLKAPLELKFHSAKVCPEGDFVSRPVTTVSAFSPYSALGACPACNGYGAQLIYDEKKIIDRDMTIMEGGLKLLNYGPFHDAYEQLLKILKKKKVPLDVPIKKLPADFFELLHQGQGQYPGYNELKRYLESKKYKPSVRIYIRQLQREQPCVACNSSRLNADIHHYKIRLGEKFYGQEEIMGLTVLEAHKLFSLKTEYSTAHEKRLWQDILEKLSMAKAMGLNHLSLLRKAKSLSAGEYQRLLLIKYLSFQGTDSLFILDEPSLGLAELELDQLMHGLDKIIQQGNTVVLIDHSEYVQRKADHLIVMGPGSGKAGGEVLYAGHPREYFKHKVPLQWEPAKVLVKEPKFIEVSGLDIFGYEYDEFRVPVGVMTWVTGNSGTGKTACLIHGMANALYRRIHGEWLEEVDFSIRSLKNTQKFEDVVVIASELNRFTSRSSVGTITELASVIRKHFLKLPVAKSMKLKEGHLSANSELGMCPKCEGKGSLTIEMQYLEDIVLECEECKGLKLKPLYASISDGQMTVAEAYQLPLGQVLERIELTPKFKRVWEYLKILNLDYLSLERGLNSLSGGEKQRIYLLSRLLSKIQNSLLIFENISFGLSERELSALGHFLNDLLKFQNTLVIIDSSNCFKHLASWKMDFSDETIQTYRLD